MIDITGLSKAKILAGLYNASKVQGMGWMKAVDGDMTEAQAQELLDGGQTYFDYLQGRVMKIRLNPDATQLDPYLYDRDNGEGATQRVVDSLQ